MLITITYKGQNTIDLGYLLYKNPYRPQEFQLSYGKAYVFYPEISEECTTVALLLEMNPIDLTRGKAGTNTRGLFDYVNDRPYVSSSFMSTAISRVFGTAMTGRGDAHQELSDSLLELSATVTMLPCRGDQEKLNAVFEPLGYAVSVETFITDEEFPDWGESHYVNLTIKGKVRLRDLLKHLYVLIPVFDRQKHYWVGEDEVEKLLRLGEDWLPHHPEKSFITGRYLGRRRSLVDLADEGLTALEWEGNEEASADDSDVIENGNMLSEENPERKTNLNTQRLGSVIAALKNCGAKRVIDIGCGEGRLLALLVKESGFTKIAGVDVSHVALKRANNKLKLEQAGDSLKNRVELFQGSLTYKDARFSGYDAACVIEVIEHLDLARLNAFERVLFEFAKPSVVVLTTPNKEYNENYELAREDGMRHGDHRFEWTRDEFKAWASKVAKGYGYDVSFSEIGEVDKDRGAPTQMAVFRR